MSRLGVPYQAISKSALLPLVTRTLEGKWVRVAAPTYRRLVGQRMAERRQAASGRTGLTSKISDEEGKVAEVEWQAWSRRRGLPWARSPRWAVVGEGDKRRPRRRTRRQRSLFPGLGGESVLLRGEALIQCGRTGIASGA